MDWRDVKIGLLLFFVIVLVGIFFINIKPPVVGEEMLYLEEPLYKNKELHFDSDEILFYVYTSGDLSTNMTYEVGSEEGCTYMNRLDYPPVSCLEKDGTDELNSNITLRDPSLFFFKPWMLAVDERWEWVVEGCFEIDGELDCDFDIHFKTIRTDFEDGEKYYVVRINYGSSIVYQWIEEDRRILTKEIGPDYIIVLED